MMARCCVWDLTPCFILFFSFYITNILHPTSKLTLFWCTCSWKIICWERWPGNGTGLKNDLITKGINLECSALLMGGKEYHPFLPRPYLHVLLIKFPFSGLNKAAFCCLLTEAPKCWRRLYATKLPQQKWWKSLIVLIMQALRFGLLLWDIVSNETMVC